MKTEHTPGPWVAYTAGDENDSYIGTADGHIIVAERVAPNNTHLIAAAPKLLDILERIAATAAEFATDPDCDSDPYDLMDAIHKDAQAAIAEAGGVVVSVDMGGWFGSPDPVDPDNFWIDDETGERVNAHTGERTKA